MRRRIAISVSEYTQGCVEVAREVLEAAGCEVVPFTADGEGGRALEDAIRSGQFDGVLDVTLHELADFVFGGVGSAGAHRLEAAAFSGTPAVVTPGGLDMVRFGRQESVPIQFTRRRLHILDPEHAVMRVDNDQAAHLGRLFAEKLNASTGPVRVFMPLRGLSSLGGNGGPFRDSHVDTTFFGNFTSHIRRDIELFEALHGINDAPFARACAESLLSILPADTIV